MKINPVIIPKYDGYEVKKINNHVLTYPVDTVSFKSKPNFAKSFITQRLFNKVFNRKLCDCNLEKLEGIQNGLKTFDGLSMKKIAIALTDLHAINMVSGCTRHCLHCYANAQPFLKRGSYEDLKQICDDIKTLSERTGAKSCHHHGQGYINISFDADALDCHLFDKQGNKYDYIDIAKLIYESTGYKPVFDTNGWDTIEKQKIAEEYVEKLIKDDNYKNFHQINISINPFNPKYVKALKSGYPVEQLYKPFEKVILNPNVKNKEENIPEDFKKAQELYTKYVKNTARVLLTFKPLIEKDKLNVIIRALNDEILNMKGYRSEDFSKTISHIYTELYFDKMCGNLSGKEFSYYEKILSSMDNRIFTSGRMEKFYKVSNKGKLDGIENIDTDRTASQERLKKIKKAGILSAGQLRYLRMICPDGKVYLYDNYAIIPTDIQLKTSIEKTEKPFQIKVEDFEISGKMFDII